MLRYIKQSLPRKWLAWILFILNLLGAFACGSYVMFCFIAYRFGSIRTFIGFVYLLLFSMVIPSAEFGLMHHPHLAKFARFMTSPLGRAFLYIFMGGLVLGNGIGGWVVGIYLLAVGVINVTAGCFLKDEE